MCGRARRYLHNGVYPVGITLTAPTGQVVTTQSSVTVSHLVIVHGISVPVDVDGTADSYVATFTSNNPHSIAEEFLAFVDWGDGTRCPDMDRSVENPPATTMTSRISPTQRSC